MSGRRQLVTHICREQGREIVPSLHKIGLSRNVFASKSHNRGAKNLRGKLRPGEILLNRPLCGTGIPRSLVWTARSAAAWQRTSSADRHKRTPILPVPYVGLSTTGRVMESRASTACWAVLTQMKAGTPTPACCNRLRCSHLLRHMERRPEQVPESEVLC